MDKNNQTAVEWLMEQILPTISITLEDVCIKELTEIAIAMEKEQIIDACNYGDFEELGEQYYNETYGN